VSFPVGGRSCIYYDPEVQFPDTIDPDTEGISACRVVDTTWQTMQLQQQGVTAKLIEKDLPLNKDSPIFSSSIHSHPSDHCKLKDF